MLHGQNTESLNITACGTYSSTGLYIYIYRFRFHPFTDHEGP